MDQTKESEVCQLTEPARTFHLEEFKQLRTEVLALLARLDTLLQYTIIGTTTAYTWIMVQAFGVRSTPLDLCLRLSPYALHIVIPVPPIFVLLMGLMCIVTWKRIGTMGNYLQRLEENLGQRPLGWEKHHQQQSSRTVALSAAIWILLLLGTLIATSMAYYLLHTATNVPACVTHP